MLKRFYYFFILISFVFVVPFSSAIDLSVEKNSENEVMILGIDSPAIFDLDITNNGPSENFMIYTFFGSGYQPKDTFKIENGQTKNIKFSVSPPYDISRTGFISFEYFVKGLGSDEYKDQLLVKIIELEEAFKIGSVKIDPETNSFEVYFDNKVNFNFEDLNVKISSAFFNVEDTFSLAPYQRKTFKIDLNQEDFKKLEAGFYTMNAQVTVSGKLANVEGIIDFEEKSSITETSEDYGFLVATKILTKSNIGNTDESVSISVQKNIFSRLFTFFSPQPDSVIRNGFKVNYFWNADLKPGEELRVKVKTNWLFPLILIILIVGTTLLVKEYTTTNLKVRKKVAFVKSKGGEFALNVTLMVHARKQVNNVLLIERIPPLLKLYKNMGKEEPKKIDEPAKKMEWEFGKLEAGERRMISYVIYSKVGVMGEFALPRTVVVYEREGKIYEGNSNRVFFVAEQFRE